jgi:hypothetical protein
MFNPELTRRGVLGVGLLGALAAARALDWTGTALAAPPFVRPLACSPTVSYFASALLQYEREFPATFLDAIEHEIERSDVPRDSADIERRRSEYFAWLAVRVIAPHYLRRAGYDDFAAECETQSSLDTARLVAASAQHAIGKQYSHTKVTPREAQFAYGASARTCTSASYACNPDMKVASEAGHFCARALLETFSYEDAPPAEIAAIWHFALQSMNTALQMPKPDGGPQIYARTLIANQASLQSSTVRIQCFQK